MSQDSAPVRSYQQWIGGRWEASAGGETAEVTNPASGQPIATVARRMWTVPRRPR